MCRTFQLETTLFLTFKKETKIPIVHRKIPQSLRVGMLLLDQKRLKSEEWPERTLISPRWAISLHKTCTELIFRSQNVELPRANITRVIILHILKENPCELENHNKKARNEKLLQFEEVLIGSWRDQFLKL